MKMDMPEERKNNYKIYLYNTKGKSQEKFEYPLYQQCYANALEIMWKNIRHNKSIVGFLEDSHALHSNIIAFMGTRGGGKTTALSEFNSILRDYERYKSSCGRELFNREETRKEGGCFYVLRNIDASLLEKQEDIVELIWANMYRDFEIKSREHIGQRCDNYRNEEAKTIIEKFDKVYRNYKLSRERKEVLGDTPLVKLKDLASSLKTRAEFDELVKNFLSYMLSMEKQEKNDNSFLVVTVDDLDMKLESGYRFLEDLCRYMNNPRIVVLIAVDFRQMKVLSDKYFEDTLVRGESQNARYAERLSNDLLLKMLPLSNRIFLPDQKNILRNVDIVASGRETDLKQFILSKIAEKIGIYYDAKGIKQHFVMPRTLRELVQYNDFLETLYDYRSAENEADMMRLYDVNHERFNQDISESMPLRILDAGQQQVFEWILERNLEHRAEYAVSFLNSRIATFSKWIRRRKVQDTVDEQSYGYCDLLKAVYDLGRKNFDDKALVHCVLASFTSEMTREYYSYLYNKDNQGESKKSERCLESILGRTFSGTWFEGYGPVVVRTGTGGKGEEEFRIQYTYQGDMKFEYKSQIEASGDDINKLTEAISHLVPVLECAMQLFPNCYDKNKNVDAPQWHIEIRKEVSESGDKPICIISLKNDKADFDIFGFVGKEMQKEHYEQGTQNRVVAVLLESIKTFWETGKKQQLTKKEWKKCKAVLNKQSIWVKDGKRRIYFPFYNLDLAYNVIKRARKKIIREMEIAPDGIVNYLQEVYGYIAEEMSEEEEYYKKNQEKFHPKITPDLGMKFAAHPFIQKIGYRTRSRESEGKTKVIEVLNELLNEMLTEFKEQKLTEEQLAEAGIAD